MSSSAPMGHISTRGHGRQVRGVVSAPPPTAVVSPRGSAKPAPIVANFLGIGPAPGSQLSAARAHGSCYPTPTYGPIDARTPKVHGVFPQKATTQMPSGPACGSPRLACIPPWSTTSGAGFYPPAFNSEPRGAVVEDSAAGQRDQPNVDFSGIDVDDTGNHLRATSRHSPALHFLG